MSAANCNNNTKIWNPAFTESNHERHTKQLLLSNRNQLGLLAHAAAVGGFLPPSHRLRAVYSTPPNVSNKLGLLSLRSQTEDVKHS